MNTVALVARREWRERVRTKTFLIGSAALALLPAAAIVVPALIRDDGPRTRQVALVGTTPPPLAAALEAGLPGTTIETRALPDRTAARAAIRAGDVDAAVIDGRRLLTEQDPSEALTGFLRQAVTGVLVGERLREAGLGPDEARAVLDLPPIPQEEVAPQETVRKENQGVAFVGLLFVYLMVLGYGTGIATAVLEEKTSRVSDVLLGVLRPHHLLAGKVVGLGLAALGQLVVVVAACGVATLAVGSRIDIPDGSVLTFAAVGMWTLLGYGLYACAFAAAGATASRPEEVGNVTFPLTAVIMASYFASLGAISEPNRAFATILSFIPPTAPMTMLPRAAVGDVAPWEVPLSVALVLVFTYGLVELAGRIYAGGITRSGGRVTLRDAWRAAD